MKKVLTIILFSPILIPICFGLGILRIVNKKAYDSIEDKEFNETKVF